MILILFYLSSYLISYINKINNKFYFIYTSYIMYHIPILKYNVNWSSQLHQVNTITLNSTYITNILYNNILNIIIIYLLYLVYFFLYHNYIIYIKSYIKKI